MVSITNRRVRTLALTSVCHKAIHYSLTRAALRLAQLPHVSSYAGPMLSVSDD
jgi:hypothetical protein